MSDITAMTLRDAGKTSVRKKITHLQSKLRSGTNESYERLRPKKQDIRVLDLQKGVGDDPIRCTLRRVSLNDKHRPAYETISYVWGDKTERATLYLHGRSCDVPRSSAAALRRMRLPDRTRSMWIDAVCINQGDDAERSQQVSIMDNIYSNGIRNLIWLGEDDQGVESALSDIDLIVEDMRTETKDFQDVESILYTNGDSGDIVTSSTPMNVRIRDWKALSRFLSNAWFQRLWVVQEAALSVRNVCFQGSYEFPLLPILRAALWSLHKYQYSDTNSTAPFDPALKIASFADKQCGRYNVFPDSGWSMFNLLLELRASNASDARDHVFGVLGLARRFAGISEIPPKLEPNYGLSPKTVACNFIKFELSRYKKLEILSYVYHRPDDDPNEYASWTPRIDRPYDASVDAYFPARNTFRADNGVRMDVSLLESAGADILPVEGVLVDCIKETTEVLELFDHEETTIFEEYERVLKPVQDIIAGVNKPVKIEIGTQIMASTLVMGTSLEGARMDEATCLAYYEAYLTCLGNGIIPGSLRGLGDTCKEADTRAVIYRQAMHMCINRRAFSTRSGYLGLGHQNARAGDVVVVLHGGKMPFILRPLDGSLPADHQLIGECYVHGIMDGEAVVAHRADGKQDSIFYLR